MVTSGSHEFLPANIGWWSEIPKIFFVSPMFGSELLVGLAAGRSRRNIWSFICDRRDSIRVVMRTTNSDLPARRLALRARGCSLSPLGEELVQNAVNQNHGDCHAKQDWLSSVCLHKHVIVNHAAGC